MTQLITFDLEFNQPSKNIIQIGACKGDLETGKVIKRFNAFINSKIYLTELSAKKDCVTEYITNLTGITQGDLDNGFTLDNASISLNEFVEGTFPNPICWGSGDTYALRDQLSDKGKFPFGYGGFFDLKKIWQLKMLKEGKKTQGGLAKVMTKVGLNFEGRKHNACDDALNIWRLFIHLIEKEII